MEADRPLISTVTLTYNREASLYQCLENIRANTRNSFEMIVVDNGSSDGTLSMVRSNFPEATLITLEGNQGVWTRNFGFEVAKGKFIGQIDDDVLVLPAWDEVLLEYMEKDVGAVGPCGWFFTNWDRPNEGEKAEPGDYCDFLTGYLFLMRNQEGFRYTEGYKFWHEDLSLSFKIKSKGWRLRQSRNCCIHLSQRTEVDWDEHERSLEKVRKEWRESKSLRFEKWMRF